MRSYLYVADERARPDAGEADAVLVEATAAAAIAGWSAAHGSVWVRIGPGEQGHDDVRRIAGPALAGVFVTAARSASELAALATVLAQVEEAAGLPVGRLAVVPRLETAAAVLAAAEIARAPRVVRLQLAEGPLCVQLGLEPDAGERELLLARSMVVLASAAGGISPPIAGAGETAGLRASSAALRRLGFRGRTCLDAEQVRVVNEVFASA